MDGAWFIEGNSVAVEWEVERNEMTYGNSSFRKL